MLRVPDYFMETTYRKVSIDSPVDDNLGGFQFWAVTNTVAKNILVQVFFVGM